MHAISPFLSSYLLLLLLLCKLRFQSGLRAQCCKARRLEKAKTTHRLWKCYGCCFKWEKDTDGRGTVTHCKNEVSGASYRDDSLLLVANLNLRSSMKVTREKYSGDWLTDWLTYFVNGATQRTFEIEKSLGALICRNNWYWVIELSTALFHSLFRFVSFRFVYFILF